MSERKCEGRRKRKKEKERATVLVIRELKRELALEEEEEDLSAGRRRYSIYATYGATAIDNSLENLVKPQ